ncbi:MAG: ATP-binding cassette domain-containing protein [Dehalococcoidales bacterium]|nr:ATP-binding cassette domain-containing protein [Dehalococcoidales bacterium]
MIRVENLTKYYGKRLAVDKISFNVGKGEIVGFLGPNAAGKTTTMRILTGYLAPSGGEAWVAGHSILSHSLEVRQHIGYFAEAAPLYTDMTVRAYLDFLARLRGLDKTEVKKRIWQVVELCHLEDYIDVHIGKLSKGFRQRTGIAQALIHNPEVLIMDEPTVGIDPIQVATTRQLIKELAKKRTVLLSTHILPEVSMTCQRVIIINKGRIVAQDRIENLSSLISGSKRIQVEVSGSPAKVTERLKRIPGVLNVSYQAPSHIIVCPLEQDLRGKITEAIFQSGWTLLSLESVEMSLEDIFIKLTTKEEAA